MELKEMNQQEKVEFKVTHKSGMQSSQNILRVCDAMVLLFYALLLVSTNYKHMQVLDAQYFVGIFLICIVLSQIILFCLGFTSKSVKTEDMLVRWIFYRKLHNLINIVFFLLLFVSGYHEIFGFVIFIVSCPIQFFLTGMWSYTIKLEEIEEKQGLMRTRNQTQYESDGFDYFPEENQA